MCEKLPPIPVESLEEVKKLPPGSYIAFADPRDFDFDNPSFDTPEFWENLPSITFIPRMKTGDSPPIEIYKLD